MQTQYQHNIYTNLSQNFVDTFIKYHLLSIIYTLYAAGDINNLCLYRHEIGTFTFQWIFTIVTLFSQNENYVSQLFGDKRDILSIVRNFYFASANILA